MRARVLRHCSRANCSVLPAVVFIVIIAAALTAAHRAGLREIMLWSGIAVAVAVVLALAAACRAAVRRSRRPAARPRQRQQASQPATRQPAGLLSVPPPAGQPAGTAPRPAGMCELDCGRLAETEAAGSRVCQPCAGWLAGHTGLLSWSPDRPSAAPDPEWDDFVERTGLLP